MWLSATPEAEFLSGRLVWANWDVEELLERRTEITQKDLLNMHLAGWTSDPRK